MSRRVVTDLFKRWAEPELAALGFTGRRGHMVRQSGPVTQVIELQHSIYGGGITANLGLHLAHLKPLVRWIPQPSVGPHAHDSTRWARIGLVSPERRDRWWTFELDAVEDMEGAVASLRDAILAFGVPWMDAEGAPEAFVRWAEQRLERGRCRECPDGTYLDLRVLAAVTAWAGRRAEARVWVERARAEWARERERLVAARAAYSRARPRAGRLPPVPDVQGELEAFIATTTASRRASSSRSRPSPVRAHSRRSRSGPL